MERANQKQQRSTKNKHIESYSRHVVNEFNRVERYQIWIALILVNSRIKYSIEEICIITRLETIQIEILKKVYKNLSHSKKLFIGRVGRYAKDELEELREKIFV